MHFTVEAQKWVARELGDFSIAVDATAGNGYDTEFLARAVGPDGTVIAMDVQKDAIDRVTQRLETAGLSQRVHCIVADHTLLEQLVAPKLAGRVDCVMFNLGYLPLGDKSITTRKESTIPAVDGALAVLRSGGVMTLLGYVGHPGGREESEAVQNWLHAHRDQTDVTILRDETNPVSPILWAVRKK